MSIERLQTIARLLPYALREQVVGYARSVATAAPEIAEAAGVRLTDRMRDDLTFVAGLRKLYGICASSYWAVDGAASFLSQRDVASVRMGSTDYSRGGQFHLRLRQMLNDLDRLLEDHDLRPTVRSESYIDIARRLAHEP